MSKKRELTTEQVEAARKLKKLFVSNKPKHNLTYEKASIELGWTTSALTQYLNGYVALNMDALIRICSLAQINAVEVYPELFRNINLSSISDPDGLIEGFHRADAKTQAAIRVLLERNP